MFTKITVFETNQGKGKGASPSVDFHTVSNLGDWVGVGMGRGVSSF